MSGRLVSGYATYFLHNTDMNVVSSSNKSNFKNISKDEKIKVKVYAN